MSTTREAVGQQDVAEAAEPESEALPREQVRRVSLDVLRGGLLAFMLFTPPFRFPETYPFLEHAAWLGWTGSDLIFPLFLFTSGGSLGYMLRRGITADKAIRLVRRLLALLVLGLLYNAIGSEFDLGAMRYTGVLQLIGVTGFLGAVVVTVINWLAPKRGAIVFAVTLAGWWLVYAVVMAANDCWQTTEGCSPFHGLDTGLLGASHVYRQGEVGYDPEGIAVMIAATWIVLVGYLATMLLRDVAGHALARRSGIVMLGGGGLIALALLLDGWTPISKRVMSPGFMLLAAGIGLVAYGLLAMAFDVETRQRGITAVRATAAFPFTTLGWNALIVYLGERIITVAINQTPVDGEPGSTALLDALALDFGDRAGLVTGVLLLGVILAITGVMRALRWRVAL